LIIKCEFTNQQYDSIEQAQVILCSDILLHTQKGQQTQELSSHDVAVDLQHNYKEK